MLLFSLIFHIGVLSFHFRVPGPISPLAKEKKKKVKRIKVYIKKKDKKGRKKRQIVTTEQTKQKVPPQKNSFLGESDQSYERESVTRNIGSFRQAGRGIKTGTLTKNTIQKKRQKKVTQKKKGQSNRTIQFEDLGVGNLPNSGTDGGASLGIENGSEKLRGLAQNNDYIEDVPLGDMTNLNTIEYKYYGFYRRIKQKLEQHWGKTLREKARSIYQKGGRIPASSLKITSLVISLNRQGEIVGIIVKSTSGVQEFDDAAIESFNKAGPFPNPPMGLLKNGLAKIEWGFVVKG